MAHYRMETELAFRAAREAFNVATDRELPHDVQKLVWIVPPSQRALLARVFRLTESIAGERAITAYTQARAKQS